MKTKNNKKARFLSDDFTRVIMLILGCVCSTLVLTFSVLTIVAVTKSNFDDAPNFLFWVFISMGLSSLVTYMRNRSRYNLIRVIILFAFNLALGIVVTYAKNDTYNRSILHITCATVHSRASAGCGTGPESTYRDCACIFRPERAPHHRYVGRFDV